MPEIFEGLKKEFPSLSDNDAAKATQEIVQVAPALPAAQAYQPTTVDTAASMTNEPRLEPGDDFQPPERKITGPQVMEHLRQMADPSGYAKADAEFKRNTQGNAASIGANILKIFPRLSRFGEMIEGNRAQGANTAKADMDRRFEAMKLVQGQENADRDYEIRGGEFGLKLSDEQRAAIKFKQDQEKAAREAALAAALDDANSAETQVYRGLMKQYFPKMAPLADRMNGTKIKEMFPQLAQGFNSITSSQEAQARLAETRSQNQLKRDESAQEKEAKENERMVSFENTKLNLDDNIDAAIKMIGEHGTSKVFGPFNKQLSAIYEDTAYAMAKMKNPNVEPRRAAIQAELENLPKVSATEMTDASAIALLQSFKKQAQETYANAYAARNKSAPDPANASAPAGNAPQAGSAIIKKQYSPSQKKTYITRANGSVEVVDGQQ